MVKQIEEERIVTTEKETEILIRSKKAREITNLVKEHLDET